MSAIATYLTQSGKRRICRCHTCETQFSETRETVFFDLRTAEDKVMMALKMLLVRVDLTGICCVLGVTEETVLAWLRRAARQAEVINRHRLRDLPVTQVQLDERWNVIERKHACETDATGESFPAGEDGRQWMLDQLCPRVSVDDRRYCGATYARHRQGGRGNHQGARRGGPHVLQ